MLSDEDIQKLIDIFATKEEIKEMISDLVTKENFNNLQTSVDSYAKKADSYFQEMVAKSRTSIRPLNGDRSLGWTTSVLGFFF